MKKKTGKEGIRHAGSGLDEASGINLKRLHADSQGDLFDMFLKDTLCSDIKKEKEQWNGGLAKIVIHSTSCLRASTRTRRRGTLLMAK